MTDVLVAKESQLGISEAAVRYLPQQGGIELQHDQPGKVHSWHSHSVHETLVVLDGSMVLEYVAEQDGTRSVRSGEAAAGARIELPANTIHQSTAMDDGCSYFIVPEGGKAAVTVTYDNPIAANFEA